MKRQSGKSKVCKNYAQNPQYLGKEERFYTSSSFKNVTFFYYQLHINIHTLIEIMLQPNVWKSNLTFPKWIFPSHLLNNVAVNTAQVQLAIMLNYF